MSYVATKSPPPRGDITGRWLSWGRLVAASVARVYLVLVLALAGCALVPLLAGLTGSVVQSGSMRPHIKPGDVVLTLAQPPDAGVPLGRVITFEAPPGSAHHGTVLHRLVGKNPDDSLVTKGDANPQADSAPLKKEDITARAVVLVPLIGLPAWWLSHGNLVPLALWVLLTMVALLIEGLKVFKSSDDEAHDDTDDPSPDPPADATQPTRRAHAFAGSPIRRIALRATVALTVLAAGATLVLAPTFGHANTAFTASTQSVGNVWATAAAGPATKLAFDRNPSGSTGGIAFATQPVVVLRDAANRTANSTSALVTLEITTPNGAVLTCASNPQAAVGGRATFSGCAITKSGTYTLTARSGSLTAAVSSSIVITTGPAARLQFTTQPSVTAVANTNFAVQPRVTVQDAGGNTITGSTAAVTLALTTPGGAVLTCTANPKNAVSGLATFAGCKVNLTGTYTLRATSGTLSAATSTSFTITPGAASKLIFQVSPSNAANSAPFATQPVVVVQDASGNLVTTSTAAVTLTVTGTPGGVTLTCSANPKNASAGTASFTGCSINKKGTYTLTARSGVLTAGTSTSFVIG